MGSADEELEEIRMFLAAVREGSLLAVAEAERTSRSRVKRKLERLRGRVGVELLVRDEDGRLAPTLAGRALVDRAPAVLQEVRALLSSVRLVGSEPSGLVRVAMPEGLPVETTAEIALGFHRRFPRVRVAAITCEDPVARLPVEADLAVSFAGASPQVPCLIEEVLTLRVRCVASPCYVEAHGRPRRLHDLHRHPLFAWRGPGGLGELGDPGERWPLLRGGFVPVEPAIIHGDLRLLHALARAGAGLCLVPDIPGLPGLPEATSELVQILPNTIGARTEVQVIVPRVNLELPAIAALVELARQFAPS